MFILLLLEFELLSVDLIFYNNLDFQTFKQIKNVYKKIRINLRDSIIVNVLD